MALAGETVRTSSTQLPEPSTAKEAKPRLDISVVFTSYESTLDALKAAGKLAKHLGGQITLVVPEAVPIRLPITRPPVLLDWNENRLRAMASQCEIDTTVRLILCRDSWKALAAVLKPHSLVMIGGRHGWWPTGAFRLARKLRKAGHEVIVTETE
jgi:hypothetical protein